MLTADVQDAVFLVCFGHVWNNHIKNGGQSVTEKRDFLSEVSSSQNVHVMLLLWVDARGTYNPYCYGH